MRHDTPRTSWTIIAVLALLGTSCGDSETNPPTPTPVPTSQDGWSLVEGSPDAGMSARHDDIFFLDANNGWLVNVQSQTYGT